MKTLVSLPEDVARKLDRLAHRSGLPKSAIVASLVREAEEEER